MRRQFRKTAYNCDLKHLPFYPLAVPASVPYLWPYTPQFVASRCTRHIDYASHILGRNATETEAVALTRHCSLAASIQSTGLCLGFISGAACNYVCSPPREAGEPSVSQSFQPGLSLTQRLMVFRHAVRFDVLEGLLSGRSVLAFACGASTYTCIYYGAR